LGILENNRFAVGAPAAVLKHVYETDAKAVDGFIESALSNVGLDQLQRMREESPTGGALGQVPIQQQKRLEQVLGSLDITQEKEIVVQNMRRVINIYMDIMHGAPEEVAELVRTGQIDAKRAAEVMARHDLPFDEFGRPKTGDEPPMAGLVKSNYLFLGGEPSDENNWVKIE